MSSEAVSYYIQRFHLALETVGRGQVLVSRTHPMKHPDLVLALRHREALVEELQRRVVPFLPLGGSQPSCDPWRHALEGALRMLAARTRVEQWRAEGHAPQVRWEPSVAIVDAKTGEDLALHSWMLPELLWLLREETPHPVRSFGAGGGVA